MSNPYHSKQPNRAFLPPLSESAITELLKFPGPWPPHIPHSSLCETPSSTTSQEDASPPLSSKGRSESTPSASDDISTNPVGWIRPSARLDRVIAYESLSIWYYLYSTIDPVFWPLWGPVQIYSNHSSNQPLTLYMSFTCVGVADQWSREERAGPKSPTDWI